MKNLAQMRMSTKPSERWKTKIGQALLRLIGLKK